MKTPSTPSLVSEPVSEESAMDHLGHREKIADERWKELLEADTIQEEEPSSGVTSHHLSRRKGRLGFGKRHFGPEYKWVGYHRARAINDPGGDDAFLGAHGASFLGPVKRHYGAGDKNQQDNLFSDEIQGLPGRERHSKKIFYDHFEAAAHATEDVPIGVSSQIDLHTHGFLGKSKHNFGGMAQISSDPITDFSEEPSDQNDLASYGLNHRGKRKFLVQSNLDSGCRHNLSRPEAKSVPTFRCRSVPVLERDLPPNETPYWQDDLPDDQRALKNELGATCQTGRECDRGIKPRKCMPPQDNLWSTMTSTPANAWTPRKVDEKSAARFIEGQDLIHGVTDFEHTQTEIRDALGKSKRSNGNAHNRSEFRFDYNDSPTWKTEHFAIVKQHLSADADDDNRMVERWLPWGHCRGRKRFEVKDHLDKDDDGVECYVSASGAVMGKAKHLLAPPDHMDPNTEDKGESCFFIDPSGQVMSSRRDDENHKIIHELVFKDTVNELMDNEVQSEDSNTLAVAGSRRRTDLIRPVSARRFPQKDFEKVTPRSVTPRAQSEARIPLGERPRWKK